MQNSKIFIISLFLALSALVAASVGSGTSTTNEGLAIKRAALEARMHDRRTAGHAAMKKRQPTSEERAQRERILKAQYKPTRSAPAAAGMEKRTFCIPGIISIGCPAPNPQASPKVCLGGNYDGCSPGANYGIGAVLGDLGSAAGVSTCCRSGYTCQQVGPFSHSICLNLPFADLYRLNRECDKRDFKTQQEFADFLTFLKNGGSF